MKNIVALTLIGLAVEAMAVTPVAVWDGDFDVTTKGACTLDLNGNSFADGVVTIDAGKGVKVDFGGSFANGVTVLYRYSNLTTGREQALATLKSTKGSTTHGNLVGVELTSGNYPKGIWMGSAWSDAEKSTFTKASGTLALTYSHTAGTYAYSLANKARSQFYGAFKLKGEDWHAQGVNVGGMDNGLPSTNMKIAAIAIFNSILSDSEMTSYVWPSESGAYEASVGSGAKAWSELTWRKGTGTPVSTADLPEGSAIHVTVWSGATLTITSADAQQLTEKNIALKASQFTNGGTVNFEGGTAEAPISFEADGDANIDLGTMTLAENTHLKVTPNANKLYRVTGDDRATSALEIACTDASKGIGMTEGTQLRKLKLVANVASTGQNGGFWIQRNAAVDATVDLVAAGQVTVHECSPTLGSLSGSANVVRPYGNTCTLTLTPAADANYAGLSDQNFIIAGSAVQTLSGAFTGALTVNGGATVGFDNDQVKPSSITGPGTIRKVGTGTTTIAGAKVSKTTKPAAIEVAGGTLNFSAGQFFDAASENVALPLTVTGGTLNLNGAWTWKNDGSGWLTQCPITLGGATPTKVEGGAVTFYNKTITDALIYRGNAGANAPAEFASNWHSSYSDQAYSRNILVEKGAGTDYDLLISGIFGLSGGQFANTTVHKTGLGTVKFTGTYNFPFLVIDAGCWQLGSANALAASTTVASGATLDLGGQSLTNLTIACGGTIANGTLVSSGVTVNLTGATIGEGLSLVADLADAIAGLKPFAGVDYAKVSTVGENKYLTYNPATGTFTLRDDCKLGDELKWLPIGDSITEGEQYMGHPGQGTEESRGGYRYQLWNEFEQAGQITRSVGYRTGHSGTVEDPETCRWAWHAAQYGGVIMHDSSSNPNHGSAGLNVENTLEVAGYPDIVTVLIGVNDLSFVSSSTAYEWVFTTWRNMVAKYADQRPHSKIVVSTLLPAGSGRMTYIAPFNAFVRNAARDKTAPFDRANVVFADIALLAFNDEAIAKYFKSSDFLHPNETGAKIVAAAWMKALQPVVADLAQSSAVPVQVHNGTSGKVSVRYSKAIQSIDTAMITITGTNVNGRVENWTFTGPTINSNDPRIIEFDAGKTELIGGDYTATLSYVIGTDANGIELPSTSTSTSTSILGTGAAANVPAAFRKSFERLQAIDVTECNYGGNGPNVPCEKLSKAERITHVGYYVELQRANEAPQFVWVSMDAKPFNYTTNNVGIPTVKGGIIRSRVTELQIYGNRGNFTNTAVGDTTQTGVIEFSPWVAGSSEPGGDDFPKELKPGHYGWNDTLTDTSTLWGCMQVARETHVEGPDDYTKIAAEMIFAFNTFNSQNLTDLGIGTFSTHRNNAGGEIKVVHDWTDFVEKTGYTPFMLSAYQVKKIEIWVKTPKTSMMLFVK